MSCIEEDCVGGCRHRRVLGKRLNEYTLGDGYGVYVGDGYGVLFLQQS